MFGQRLMIVFQVSFVKKLSSAASSISLNRIHGMLNERISLLMHFLADGSVSPI